LSLQAVAGGGEFLRFPSLECCQVSLFGRARLRAAFLEIGLGAECLQAAALMLFAFVSHAAMTSFAAVTSHGVTSGRLRRHSPRVERRMLAGRLTGCLFRMMHATLRVACGQTGFQGGRCGSGQFRVAGLGGWVGGLHQQSDGASPLVTWVRSVICPGALLVGRAGRVGRWGPGWTRERRLVAAGAHTAEEVRTGTGAGLGRRLQALELGLCGGRRVLETRLHASGVRRRHNSSGRQARLSACLGRLPLGGVSDLVHMGLVQHGHTGGQILRHLEMMPSGVGTGAALAEDQDQANERQNQQTQHVFVRILVEK